jgi:lipopolysaccharide transport system ATP-binding protein
MSFEKPAVEAFGVSKQYRLGQQAGGYRLLTETIAGRLRSLGQRPPRRPEFRALDDIDFTVAQGESFGIIGHNGAGKSTLLKILARVTPPTSGEVHLRGRVGALLEVGTGFHPELTGRENIYLNGAILGMRRGEIKAKFDEIVDFAEIEQFIDTPVKRYSSGMHLRLAFAVAAHLEPEILIVDEVLAVGDLAFQEKCVGRMERVAGEGRTVLFVSHNLTAVQNLCSRAMLLSKGRKIAEGTTSDVIGEYVSGLQADTASDLRERTDREGDGRFRFDSIRFVSGGISVDVPTTGSDLEIILSYSARDDRPVLYPTVGIAIYTVFGSRILQLQSDLAGQSFRELPPSGTITCKIPRLPLPAGRYTVNLFGATGGAVADWLGRASELTVAEGDYYGSGQRPDESHQAVLIDHLWESGDDHAEVVAGELAQDAPRTRRAS